MKERKAISRIMICTTSSMYFHPPLSSIPSVPPLPPLSFPLFRPSVPLIAPSVPLNRPSVPPNRPLCSPTLALLFPLIVPLFPHTRPSIPSCLPLPERPSARPHSSSRISAGPTARRHTPTVEPHMQRQSNTHISHSPPPPLMSKVMP